MNNKKQCRGSITVEAALVMPIFIFVVVAFLYFFKILIIQEQIQESITRVSKLASQYGYVYEYLSEAGEEVNAKEEEADAENKDDNEEKQEESAEEEEKEEGKSTAKKLVQGFVDGSLFRAKFLEYMGDDINADCIVGGLEGISFLESSFMKNEDDIEVVAIYTIKITVPFLELKSFTVVQRVKSRAFVGVALAPDDGEGADEEASEDEEYVYITKTGTVYHKDCNCTYINVRISSISGSKIEDKRNSSGAKYYPCEACMSGECKEDGTYYITAYGTRYHSSKSCNKIERSVQKIKLSEVGSRKPCSKCGK